MIYNIKNSSGKITGITDITDKVIKIDNAGKPLLEILNANIINEVLAQNISTETLIILYNEYTMSIGEIASLYNRCYSNINKIIKNIPEISLNHNGRRNRAYGHAVSETQSEKMSKALKGRAAPIYERTPEIRQKTSNSLKAYFKENPQNPQPHIDNWKNGVYDKVDFKIGIGGHFTSKKINSTVRFRSLLELYYLIQLEQDESIITYQYEPFHIDMDNGKSYMPDFLINDKYLIELQPKKYVENITEIHNKVSYKQTQAIKYCFTHNLEYKLIYDEDIGFDSRRMKHYIKDNPDIVSKYNITFTDPQRMAIK